MRNSNAFYEGYGHVYPGEYEPVPGKEKETLNALQKKNTKVLEPDLNINEMPDYYKIAMQAAGFKRDDFFVHTNGFNLSVTAMNKDQQGGRPAGHGHTHRSGCRCINKAIPLPADVDTDFVTAEYNGGTLNIYLFKAPSPNEKRAGDIIVY